jgi:hypothetical protein
MKTKKLLPPDEQSLLLVSLLFARKHLDEIYSFFSESQRERMNEAKTRFLRLEQGQRVTQIILELRRLLLIKENNFHWIHPSWFEHELAKEPLYLREIIEPALRGQSSAKKNVDPLAVVSHEQILQNFLTPFINTPQRVALFDPVLMRLQSLHRDRQRLVLACIGRHALKALGEVVNTQRYNNFLKRHYAQLDLASISLASENFLAHEDYKLILITNLIKLTHKPHRDIQLEFGLWLVAIYLSTYKHSWHRMIELVLERSLGIGLRDKLEILKLHKLDPYKEPITKFLINAMDQAMIA